MKDLEDFLENSVLKFPVMNYGFNQETLTGQTKFLSGTNLYLPPYIW